MLALFTAAEQFTDRLPQAPAQAFLDHLEAQDLPADTLAARGGAPQPLMTVRYLARAPAHW